MRHSFEWFLFLSNSTFSLDINLIWETSHVDTRLHSNMLCQKPFELCALKKMFIRMTGFIIARIPSSYCHIFNQIIMHLLRSTSSSVSPVKETKEEPKAADAGSRKEGRRSASRDRKSRSASPRRRRSSPKGSRNRSPFYNASPDRRQRRRSPPPKSPPRRFRRDSPPRQRRYRSPSESPPRRIVRRRSPSPRRRSPTPPRRQSPMRRRRDYSPSPRRMPRRASPSRRRRSPSEDWLPAPSPPRKGVSLLFSSFEH